MQELLELIETFFEYMVKLGIILLESFGVMVLLVTACQSAVAYWRKTSGVRLRLAKGIALALEFKLGSEVLRTVIVREREELMILGVIILLRAALTLLIHWEIKNEQKMKG